MSIFPKMTLTNKGKALEAKLKIGDTMEFTRMGLGSGELNKPIGELLNLINEKANVSINNKQIIQEYTVQLRAFFTNIDVQERFYWREFGVFANDPDEGEILYAYSNAGDMGGWIPAVTDNRIERMIYASVQVSNAQEINITIPQSDTFIPTSEKGVADGVASLDSSGKVPESQLPELDFDSAGSAAAVQGNLNAHINNKQNPHGVTAAQVGAATTTLYNATLPVSWSGTAPYTQTVSITGITADDYPIIDTALSGDSTSDKLILEAWSKVSRITTQVNGITITCYEEAPMVAIPIKIKVVR